LDNKEELLMKLVPLGDKVVLKQLVAEETTKSGIVLPGQAKEKPQQAEVIAVGPGGMVDGKEITMQVKVGDRVIFSKYAGTEVKLDEEEFIIVKQNDIVAIIED
jgi:chaperonin GroES